MSYQEQFLLADILKVVRDSRETNEKAVQNQEKLLDAFNEVAGLLREIKEILDPQIKKPTAQLPDTRP